MSPLARPAWLGLALLSGVVASLVVARWLWAVTLGGPVLYGEGAVAHAALLARDGAEFVPFTAPVFVAANYTPLFFHVVSLGEPFVWGRLVSVGCTLAVAAAIAWRARAASVLVAGAMAAAWLALAPVASWGAAVKPDLLALALTVAAVCAADVRSVRGETRWPLAAGVLIALAISAKPTAALPALAVGVWLLGTRRAAAGAYATGAIVTVAIALILTPGGLTALRRHVIEHNALPWDPTAAAGLAVIGALAIGVPVAGAIVLRSFRSATGAYLVGALGIVVLGGREGATVNYLLDLSAASTLALASVAPRLSASSVAPALAAIQLVAGLLLLDPLGAAPGRMVPGRWGDPARLVAARTLPEGPVLAEDSGLLVAQGREPIVDDLFLWSRLAERGALDRAPLLDAIRAGVFVRVVSEVDLSQLGQAPGHARQRWPDWLAGAVLERYVLERRDGSLHIYRPR